MKQWLKFLFHNNSRKLEISTGGKWYLGFTIILGVVAINSGNNVIYLLESLLLSALLFSGILSEQTLRRIEIRRILGEARAGAVCSDFYEVKNSGIIPLFCFELGEFSDGKFQSHAFVLSLLGKEDKKIRSRQEFHDRGEYYWGHLAIATSFPFGFAKKIRLINEAGSRIVWPRGVAGAGNFSVGFAPKNSPAEISPGEIEELPEGSDLTRVHWPSSARAQRWIARSRKNSAEENELTLEIEAPGEEMEKKISETSQLLHKHKGAISLLLKDKEKNTKIMSRIAALNAISVLPKGGS